MARPALNSLALQNRPVLRCSQVSVCTKDERQKQRLELANAIDTAHNGYMKEAVEIADKFGRRVTLSSICDLTDKIYD